MSRPKAPASWLDPEDTCTECGVTGKIETTFTNCGFCHDCDHFDQSHHCTGCGAEQ